MCSVHEFGGRDLVSPEHGTAAQSVDIVLVLWPAELSESLSCDVYFLSQLIPTQPVHTNRVQEVKTLFNDIGRLFWVVLQQNFPECSDVSFRCCSDNEMKVSVAKWRFSFMQESQHQVAVMISAASCTKDKFRSKKSILHGKGKFCCIADKAETPGPHVHEETAHAHDGFDIRNSYFTYLLESSENS